MGLHLAQEARADELLERDPLALAIGMLLDQQVPMEWAFGAPRLLAERLGVRTLDAADLAGRDPEEFAAIFVGPPALHRYPGSMAGRVQALAVAVRDDYGNDITTVWTGAASGADLVKRLRALPGFGEQKAKIFAALLGKQFGVRPTGWREAAGAYGEEGSYRSIADVTDGASLARVREYKQQAKAAKRAG